MAKPADCIFKRSNYYLILTSIVLLITGFLMMTGSSNIAGSSFNNDIYSFRRITLAPIVLLAGYSLMIYAIMTVQGEKEKHKE
jgi:NhaP-type Na+/H+ or K+/H+ antiporter